jgi:hypothetical protein
MRNKFETKTFTFNEYEKGQYSSYADEKIFYCSYCGKKAMRDDIGSSHNHRWDEHIIYFCDCEDALTEIKLKGEASSLRHEVWLIENKIRSLQERPDCESAKKMKYEYELNILQKKFGVGK